MKHDVFISYSSNQRDVATAKAISQALTEHGISNWVETTYGEEAKEPVEAAEIFLVVHSHYTYLAAIAMRTLNDLRYASAAGKYIIPYCVDPTPVTAGAVGLARSRAIYINDYDQPLEKLDELIAAIKRRLAGETDAPAQPKRQGGGLTGFLTGALSGGRKAAPAAEPTADLEAICEEAAAAYEDGDYDKAAQLYRQAADQGNCEATFWVGVCYHNGEGVEENREESIMWYRKAAEQGHAEAQYQMGLAYDFGSGVEEDKAEAAKWYRMSAEQDYADAQAAIAGFYEEGTGVEKDLAEAIKWYRRAAENGDDIAGMLADKIEEEMQEVVSDDEPEEECMTDREEYVETLEEIKVGFSHIAQTSTPPQPEPEPEPEPEKPSGGGLTSFLTGALSGKK